MSSDLLINSISADSHNVNRDNSPTGLLDILTETSVSPGILVSLLSLGAPSEMGNGKAR